MKCVKELFIFLNIYAGGFQLYKNPVLIQRIKKRNVEENETFFLAGTRSVIPKHALSNNLKH